MTDAPFILHHYDLSPYAEKIRLLLGIAEMPWHSVRSPVMPPRPITEPLTGGYRRIPVAQIGADVFCDSRLIAIEVAHLSGLGRLAPNPGEDPADALIKRAEGDVFFASAGAAPTHVLLGTVLHNFGALGTLRFALDRFHMLRSATSTPPQGRAAIRLYRRFINDLNDALANRRCFAGDDPGYADAALYHVVWLNNQARRAPLNNDLPHLKRWFEHIAQIGHGPRHESDADVAFDAARRAAPRPLPESDADDEHHRHLGHDVAVHPTDYLPTPTLGKLVALTPERIVVARQDADLGTIHVHFPRRAYAISPA